MRIRTLHMIEGARQASGTAVIIDVFRAFSVEAYIMSGGAKKLLPVGDMQLAYSYREKDPDCILIGEREGVKLPGFDYGNSPSQIQHVDFTGKTVVHTTSAGTQGIANAENASEVLTGSLVNAKAIARYILESGTQDVSLVCMGLQAREQTEEDNLCAAYIRSILEGRPIAMEDAIENLKRTSGAKFFDPARQKDFPQPDFDLCTRVDRFPFVLKVDKDESGERFIRRIDL